MSHLVLKTFIHFLLKPGSKLYIPGTRRADLWTNFCMANFFFISMKLPVYNICRSDVWLGIGIFEVFLFLIRIRYHFQYNSIFFSIIKNHLIKNFFAFHISFFSILWLAYNLLFCSWQERMIDIDCVEWMTSSMHSCC